jgi:hypothetical protein
VVLSPPFSVQGIRAALRRLSALALLCARGLPGLEALDVAAAFLVKLRAGYGVVELTDFDVTFAALL